MSDTFDSARLHMRPQRIEDAEALFEAYGDADLMRWWSSGPHASVEETRAYMAPRLAKSDWRGWAITVKGSDHAIGTLAAGEKRSGVTEIGYMLVRSAWGQGYAREGVSRLIDLLIREEGYRRVFADTDPENIESNRLLENLGFTREGLLRLEWQTHIGLRDSYIWGLLASDWIARAPSADPARLPGDHRAMDAITLPLRRTGVMFAVLGLLLAAVRQVWAPGMPVAIPAATLALAGLNLMGGATVRMMYRRRRM